MATKHSMADALRVVLTDDGERVQTRAHLAEAVRSLLAAGPSQGATRPQVEAQDVLTALGGISVMTGAEQRPGLAPALIDLPCTAY
jgi:hypothetical protein